MTLAHVLPAIKASYRERRRELERERKREKESESARLTILVCFLAIKRVFCLFVCAMLKRPVFMPI